MKNKAHHIIAIGICFLLNYQASGLTIVQNSGLTLQENLSTESGFSWLEDRFGEGFLISYDRKGPLGWPGGGYIENYFYYFDEFGTLRGEVTDLSIESAADSYLPGTPIEIEVITFPDEPYLDQIIKLPDSNINYFNAFDTRDDLYVGFATGFSPGGGDIDEFNVFGWFRLTVYLENPFLNFLYRDSSFEPARFQNLYPNAEFKLALVESVIAYDSLGIVVGTTDAIPAPEPSSFMIFSSAIFLSSSIFHRRRNTIDC